MHPASSSEELQQGSPSSLHRRIEICKEQHGLLMINQQQLRLRVSAESMFMWSSSVLLKLEPPPKIGKVKEISVLSATASECPNQDRKSPPLTEIRTNWTPLQFDFSYCFYYS